MPPAQATGASGPEPTSIKRSLRACSHCRQRKQRCDGAEVGVPCTRCKAHSLDCSFDQDALDPRYNPYARVAMTPKPRPAKPLPRLSGQEVSSTSSSLSLQEQISDLQERVLLLERGSIPREYGGSHHFASPASVDAERLHSGPLDLANSNLNAPLDTIASLGGIKTSQSDGQVAVPLSRVNDPIELGVVTKDEIVRLFRIYFDFCHPVAPFLDARCESDPFAVAQVSVPLLLAITVTAARYWSYNAASYTRANESWLHPRYARLVKLLDAELARLALKPASYDERLETVEAFLVYGHWFPFDEYHTPQGTRVTSRYKALDSYHIFGQALRWADLLGLDRTAHRPFEADITNPFYQHPSHDQLRSLRVYAYLVESDHHLASLAHYATSTNPKPLCNPNVVLAVKKHPLAQATDTRVLAILHLADALHNAGLESRDPSLKQISPNALVNFNAALDGLEAQVWGDIRFSESSADNMLAHMPFTSLRWSRLALNCSCLANLKPPSTNLYGLDSIDSSGLATLQSAVMWASQMLYHLSEESTTNKIITVTADLRPERQLVQRLTFSIDQYFLTISYAAVFLVLAWHRGLINKDLVISHGSNSAAAPTGPASLLDRLLRLVVASFTACSPAVGHTALPYVELLTNISSLVESGPYQMQAMQSEAQDPSTDIRVFLESIGTELRPPPANGDLLSDINSSMPFDWLNDWLTPTWQPQTENLHDSILKMSSEQPEGAT